MYAVAIGGIGKSAIDVAASIIAGSCEMLKKIGDNILNIVKGVDGTTQLSQISTQVHSVVKGTAIPALQGVGFAIALLFFLLALIDLLRSERLTTETYIKIFINLFIAIFFIFNADELYSRLISFGDGLGTQVANIFGRETWVAPTKEELYEKFVYFAELPKTDPHHQHWMGILATCFIAGAPVYLICMALTIVTYMIAFSRLIELAVRGAFLPIGIAMLSDDGFRGAGGRYFKKFMAICAQVAVLIMIAGITTLIIGTVGKNFTEGILSGTQMDLQTVAGRLLVVVGAAVACVSVMFKSIGLINDVFGA